MLQLLIIFCMCEKLHEAGKMPPPCELFPGGSGASFQRSELANRHQCIGSNIGADICVQGLFFSCSLVVAMLQ